MVAAARWLGRRFRLFLPGAEWGVVADGTSFVLVVAKAWTVQLGSMSNTTKKQATARVLGGGEALIVPHLLLISDLSESLSFVPNPFLDVNFVDSGPGTIASNVGRIKGKVRDARYERWHFKIDTVKSVYICPCPLQIHIEHGPFR